MGMKSEATSTVQTQPPINNMEMVSHRGTAAVCRPIGGNHKPRTKVPMKRKCGRQRNYHPGQNMVFAVTPISVAPPGPSDHAGRISPSASTASTCLAEAEKKDMDEQLQMDALGSSGTGFILHIMTIEAGEDVGSKIMSTFQNGSRSFCILSAIGAISSVTIQRAATSGPVTYEGPFEILSLSGSYVLSESAGRQTWNGALSVSLAGIDGWVLGGRVAGLFRAATPVKVIAGSFIAGVEEPKQSDPLVNAP
ncbi:AT-hook motif nuclear-localized protein 10-like [Phoenix dactylifera]|uniref:AT-hook motif nuclear-localized protein n=1 Tax=Phoenix dactylifera TaxID=42345 RepID=A0A8B9ALR3_PHODC|nr:AT-hook motif nuclear-localized protein 10-like [Phoenix dactylifera]